MTEEQYNARKQQIAHHAKLAEQRLVIDYCQAHNPYKIGDVFTDHIGSIRIDQITYDVSLYRLPCCVYTGVELKKDGTPKASGSRRAAYQVNDVKSDGKG